MPRITFNHDSGTVAVNAFPSGEDVYIQVKSKFDDEINSVDIQLLPDEAEQFANQILEAVKETRKRMAELNAQKELQDSVLQSCENAFKD